MNMQCSRLRRKHVFLRNEKSAERKILEYVAYVGRNIYNYQKEVEQFH